MTHGDQPARPPEPGAPLLDAPLLGAPLLGAPLRWTRDEVAERAGVPLEQAIVLWGALGFPEAEPHERVFTDRDVAALRATQRLQQLAGTHPDQTVVLARVMGRSLARLADGQLDAVLDTLGLDQATDTGTELVDNLESLMVYVWRRHLYAAFERALTLAEGAGTLVAVGFVDLVGYTSRSRDLAPAELTELLTHFDEIVSEAVVATGGRVVKTIGDEVMWVHDRPADAAACALRLVAELVDPAVRVGLAYGTTVTQGGDHFGPVVNLAARLTGLAKPGSVLADRALAAALEQAPERFRLRTLRPVRVRGYDHLVATVVRPA